MLLNGSVTYQTLVWGCFFAGSSLFSLGQRHRAGWQYTFTFFASALSPGRQQQQQQQSRRRDSRRVLFMVLVTGNSYLVSRTSHANVVVAVDPRFAPLKVEANWYHHPHDCGRSVVFLFFLPKGTQKTKLWAKRVIFTLGECFKYLFSQYI